MFDSDNEIPDSERVHEASDVNKSRLSQHHTLGTGPNEALPGNFIRTTIGAPAVGTKGDPGSLIIDLGATPPVIYVFNNLTGTYVAT